MMPFWDGATPHQGYHRQLLPLVLNRQMDARLTLVMALGALEYNLFVATLMAYLGVSFQSLPYFMVALLNLTCAVYLSVRLRDHARILRLFEAHVVRMKEAWNAHAN